MAMCAIDVERAVAIARGLRGQSYADGGHRYCEALRKISQWLLAPPGAARRCPSIAGAHRTPGDPARKLIGRPPRHEGDGH